ncbi:iron complex transport system permease protein [Pseudomonas marginalis]|uniref:FecCD family ABC transporter permease n=1 Tax=Pseudomonas marginalis TaxID=298 RepID=UPI00209ED9B6|nr:iron ABC transporter permease [Pseudomonas marginalis]MCP1507700.1 iron complex transport system permease protein [Pseudomonas marginalis]MCP1525204.1 iron complex transport system permease protein [Pseudomonas marginalis]MDQ0500201.1 iron complex transport system permease protein [Pseudomonas marginalis]
MPRLARLDSWGLPVKDALLVLADQGDAVSRLLINTLRMPRILAAVSTGAAGCLMQTLARNRLATPGIVGLDNGATAFAVASIVATSTSLLPSILALSGAATAVVLTFALASGSGSRGYRFIVTGIGVGAMFSALTNLMLSQAPIDAANRAYPWTVGSLNGTSAVAIRALAAGLFFGSPWACLLGRRLAAMGFSERVSISLGVRLTTLAATVWLTALGVAVVGPVGLVALIAPEIARYLARQRGVPVLNSAWSGALLMVVADLAGRNNLSPIEVPVGIVMAIIGGPYLIWIVLRQPDRRVQ